MEMNGEKTTMIEEKEEMSLQMDCPYCLRHVLRYKEKETCRDNSAREEEKTKTKTKRRTTEEGGSGDVEENMRKKSKRSVAIETTKTSDIVRGRSSSIAGRVNVRFAYFGQTLRAGVCVALPEDIKKSNVTPRDVLGMLESRVETDRFAITFYDHESSGWRALENDSEIKWPTGCADSTAASRIEIMLRDKTVSPASLSGVPLGLEEKGFFGIGIYRGKTAANHGTLWRSAYQMGASFIFTIGSRFQRYASDTTQAWTKIPVFQFPDFASFASTAPFAAPWIAIELNRTAVSLKDFKHPRRAIYILGAEDNGLPRSIKEACRSVVYIPCARSASMNVAAAGSVVMYDRVVKRSG